MEVKICCENCIKQRTMKCPASDVCYSTANMPYFVPKNYEIKYRKSILERFLNLFKKVDE